MSLRIGIFSGTFDPVHNGHISIAKAFLASGKIDQLWILPTPDPPHKPDQVVSSYQVRFELVQLAFKNVENIIISDFETKLKRPSYTLRTIRALKKEYPAYQFFLCLGSDSLEYISSWYHYQELVNECQLLIAKRPDFDSRNVDQDILSKCFFVDNKPIDISSTQIKRALQEGRGNIPELPEEVLSRINEMDLYH